MLSVYWSLFVSCICKQIQHQRWKMYESVLLSVQWKRKNKCTVTQKRSFTKRKNIDLPTCSLCKWKNFLGRIYIDRSWIDYWRKIDCCHLRIYQRKFYRKVRHIYSRNVDDTHFYCIQFLFVCVHTNNWWHW